jgi:glycerate dehydrogenase
VLHEATRQDEVAERIADCEYRAARRTGAHPRLDRRREHAALIALAATGANNVDLEAARERGVAVCNARDYCTPSVVQHVLGVLLALTHRFADYSRDAIDGTWASSPHFTILRHPIRELSGRTLGVVGWGVLGKAVAQACETALGMRVIVADRIGAAHVEGRVPLAELLATAGCRHAPSGERTHHAGMIGAREISSDETRCGADQHRARCTSSTSKP